MLSFSSSVWFKRNRCWRRRPGQDGGGEAGAGKKSDGETKTKVKSIPVWCAKLQVTIRDCLRCNSNKLVLVVFCAALSNVKVQFDF